MIIIGPFTLLLLVLLLFKPIRKLAGFLLCLAFIGLVYMCSSVPAQAAQPQKAARRKPVHLNCDAPPYSDTEDAYSAAVSYLMQGESKENSNYSAAYLKQFADGMIQGFCNVKAGKLDRSPLYQYGFTDRQIAAIGSATLAQKVMSAVYAANGSITLMSVDLANAIAKQEAEKAATEASAPPGLYSVLMCIDGAGCRFFDTSTVFNGLADCNRYAHHTLMGTGNVHYSCVPVQYSQSSIR